MQPALYQLEADTFVPSDRTIGPWDDAAQHGGPPSALIARALERSAPTMVLNRVTVEILRPVPLTPLRVSTEVIRPGRRVQLVEAAVTTNEGTIVAMGRGWMIRRQGEPLDLPASSATADPPIGPDDSPPFDALWPTERPGFFGAGLEKRLADGHVSSPGPATAWFRHNQPIVAGEEPSGVQQMIAIADCANGIGWELDFTRMVFVNLDLTLYFWREPVGEWLGLRSASRFSTLGRGVSDTMMFDQDGPVGRANQSLFIEAR